MIDVTIPSYRINCLFERYNESLLRPTKLTLDGNNHIMKKLNFFENLFISLLVLIKLSNYYL